MGAVFVSLIGDAHAAESLTLTRTAGFFILACLTSCIESHPVSRGCNLWSNVICTSWICVFAPDFSVPERSLRPSCSVLPTTMTLMSSLGSVLVAASLLLGGVASSSAIATDEVVLSILKNVGLLIAARWSTADFKCNRTEAVCLYQQCL